MSAGRPPPRIYVVEGRLVAQVGDARVEVGPGAYAALPQGVPHTIEVVGERATLLLTFVPGGLERLFVPEDGEQSDPAAFGLTFPEEPVANAGRASAGCKPARDHPIARRAGLSRARCPTTRRGSHPAAASPARRRS